MSSKRLSISLVGLPNVGKSTLFNAITSLQVPAENYPFCTIEPHQGTVIIPDPRLDALSKLSGSESIIHSTVDFVDVAGLVKHASKGEGLGNQFLSNIRETGVICYVLRCFEDQNITHVHNVINPIDDFNVVFTELLLSDLSMCESVLQSLKKKIKSNDIDIKKRYELIKDIYQHLSESKPVSSYLFSDTDHKLLKEYQFLTQKPVCIVANVSENELGAKNKWLPEIFKIAKQHNAEVIELSVLMESEIAVLSQEEKQDYLKSYGISLSGLDQLARVGFDLLHLQTFLTTGLKETRSWTIAKGSSAPQAAGAIHSDFEKGFIRANVIEYQELIRCGSFKTAREQGLLRQEGKDYIMKDGDVVEFLTNT